MSLLDMTTQNDIIAWILTIFTLKPILLNFIDDILILCLIQK